MFNQPIIAKQKRHSQKKIHIQTNTTCENNE